MDQYAFSGLFFLSFLDKYITPPSPFKKFVWQVIKVLFIPIKLCFLYASFPGVSLAEKVVPIKMDALKKK